MATPRPGSLSPRRCRYCLPTIDQLQGEHRSWAGGREAVVVGQALDNGRELAEHRIDDRLIGVPSGQRQRSDAQLDLAWLDAVPPGDLRGDADALVAHDHREGVGGDVGVDFEGAVVVVSLVGMQDDVVGGLCDRRPDVVERLRGKVDRFRDAREGGADQRDVLGLGGELQANVWRRVRGGGHAIKLARAPRAIGGEGERSAGDLLWLLGALGGCVHEQAQLAENSGNGKCRKGDLALGVEALECLEQAERGNLEEVLEWLGGMRVTSREATREWRKSLDEQLVCRAIAVAPMREEIVILVGIKPLGGRDSQLRARCSPLLAELTAVLVV